MFAFYYFQANLTFENFLANPFDLVFKQTGFESEGVVADLSFETILIFMSARMFLHFGISLKLFVTEVASKILFGFVQQFDVPVQI